GRLDGLDPQPAGRRGEPLTCGVRVGEAIARAPGRAEQILDVQPRHHPGGLVHADQLGHRPERALERHRLSIELELSLVAGQEEVAPLTVVDVDPELLFEAGPDLHTAKRELNVDRGGELAANAARGPAGRARADSVPFEHDDVWAAPPSKIAGRGAADDAAPDDDHLSARSHAHLSAYRSPDEHRPQPDFRGVA